MERKSRCYRILCWELHVSRFCFCHHNWRAFAYTPWLPPKALFQWIYVVYRWIIALFFLIHLLWTGAESDAHFFIYLTDWGFMGLTLYFLWSSVSVTVSFMRQHIPLNFCKRFYRMQVNNSQQLLQKPPGCCGVKNDVISWYEKVQWVLFFIGTEMALIITLLFWPLFYDPQSKAKLLGHLNVVLHLVNSVVAFVDLWVSGIPVRLYHMVYVIIVGSIYVIFTGFYYAAGGGNEFDNGTYIYPQLDYGKMPGEASALVLISALIVGPVVHLFFYINYVLREGLLYLVKTCCKSVCHKEDRETNEIPEDETLMIPI